MSFAAGNRVGPYEILALLGAGGMGEVYKARDTRLQRIIALKILPAEKVADADRKKQFLVEAQAASRLNHPNIVVIHDISEQDGVCFIAMEYVAGKTLEEMIAGGGVPMKDAMKYAAEIADALAAAHGAGIIHRDLKPANIMITKDGRAKLLDFGLAKLAEPAMALGNETASLSYATGTLVGTPAYMSPEQVEGRKLDARTDVFSYGLVLYEMFSGQRAFRGETPISILAAILHEEPRGLREVRGEISGSVEQTVARCLRKDPAQRFQTMVEVKRTLTEALSLGADATSGVTAASLSTEAEIRSIAVLPFANLSADKENEYFSDGLAEEIINALTKIPELRVIARTSAFAFRGTEKDLRSIAEKLRVGTILEGSVRSAGKRIRVTAQLIQVSDESNLWSERYDREMTDIFAIQDDISMAIANALKVTFAAPQRRHVNIEAFQNYLKGLYWYQRYTQESLAKAKEAFEQALAKDPTYAPAYAGLAVFYFGLGALSVKPMIEMAPLAKSSAQKALAIDETLSEAQSVMGLVTGAVEYDWKTAERHFQAALAVKPVPPLVGLRYGLYYLTPLRRFDEAEEHYKRALETDPLSMMAHFGLTNAYYCQRRYNLAIEHAARTVEIYPDYWLAHFIMGITLSQTGAHEAAIASLRKSLQYSPTFTMAAGFLAAALVRAGEKDRAESLMAEITVKSKKQFVPPACFAIYHAALGNTVEMFEDLEAAFAQRDPYLTRMDSEPCFDGYHSDARYRSLLKRMNLD
jgi:serine/threonine protein kinase/Tfp pilus assembly protein PilF